MEGNFPEMATNAKSAKIPKNKLENCNISNKLCANSRQSLYHLRTDCLSEWIWFENATYFYEFYYRPYTGG
jgi:hypothetical protein